MVFELLTLFALVGAGAIMLVVMVIARVRCPRCRQPTVELDVREDFAGVDRESGAIKFHCISCGAEFRRQDKGPMIDRDAWDAGARDPIPAARVVPRRGD